MTTEDKSAVEKKDQTAATDQNTSAKSEFELKLEANEAELKRVREERDNYKKGMLKAKGKVTDDKGEPEDDEDIDSKISRGVQAALLEKKESDLVAQKDELLKQAGLRISELETAVKNRSQIGTSNGAGASSEQRLDPKDPVLSEEKIKAFKAMGKDDKWIERFKINLINQAKK